jgi:ubiquinone/menaquinone biosynthesis C-methylase UbiE
MGPNKIEQELQHDKNILSRAEDIWGWGTPAGQRRAARRAQYFIQLGELTRDTKVLEIGCGTGVFTRQIALTGAAVMAVDISPDFVAKSRQNVTDRNVSFKVEDIHALSLPDEAFDAVIGSSILHHLDIIQALSEIKRVLKTGGHIVFTEPNMLNPQILMERKIKFIGKILHNTPNETAFVRGKLARVMEQAGFKNIMIKPYDFLHPWTPMSCVNIVEKIGLSMEKIPLVREIAGSLVITAQK